MEENDYPYACTMIHAALVTLSTLLPCTLVLLGMAFFDISIDSSVSLGVGLAVTLSFLSYLITHAVVSLPTDPRRQQRALNVAYLFWLFITGAASVAVTLGTWSMLGGDFACDGQLCGAALLFLFGAGPLAGLAVLGSGVGISTLGLFLLTREVRRTAPPRTTLTTA